MRGVACFLLFWSSAVALLSCSSMGGTPMRGNCRYLPTVEACQAAADRYITDTCLRDCVRHLCSVGKPKCGKDEDIPLHCATRKGEAGGYVPPPLPNERRSCKQPKEEINWCELPYSSDCQAQMAVH